MYDNIHLGDMCSIMRKISRICLCQGALSKHEGARAAHNVTGEAAAKAEAAAERER